MSFQTISFSNLVLLYYILFNMCLCWPYPLQKQLKVHFFQCKPDIIFETTDIKRKKHMRHPDIKNQWDTCRNCISTSVLNCPFFDTFSHHFRTHDTSFFNIRPKHISRNTYYILSSSKRHLLVSSLRVRRLRWRQRRQWRRRWRRWPRRWRRRRRRWRRR